MDVRSSTFSGNTATYGGAIDGYYGGQLVFRGNTVFDNVATTDGAAVRLFGTPAFVEGNVFVENSAGADGGVLYAGSPSRIGFFNNTLAGNVAGSEGGGLYLAASTSVLATGNIISDGNNGEGVFAVDGTGSRHHL